MRRFNVLSDGIVVVPLSAQHNSVMDPLGVRGGDHLPKRAQKPCLRVMGVKFFDFKYNIIFKFLYV